ncbi:autotransporter outer membrane beta-barrel domain-containing protein, partial [Salmonella enterica]|nr:autotransporter outer membrane beta-barrel domain-containing protein [Salmonella enterica]
QQQDAISESSPVGEWLVAKAPAYAPSEYFSIKSSAINGQNKIITATEVIGTKKNWWAVGQQSNSTWFLESSRHFNELNMFLNDISLSPSSIFGWKPKELVVDKLQAYGTTFHFTIDPGSSVADQLVLNKSPVGGGNNFSIRYLDHADSRNINHHELLIARAPSETKGGYFTPFIKYDNETPFSSALATTKNELEEQWWIITFDKDKNWFVDHDKHFETLNLNSSGLNVSLSGKNGNIWKPHTFTVDYLSASNVNFNITANLQTLQSDKIIVNKSATGGNNYLNVSFMLDSNLPVQFKSDIVLAQAPVATNNTYFTVSPVLKGLSIYTPEFSIITSGEKKEWRLTHNTVDMTALTPAKETVPMTALTPAKETVPMTALTPAKETVPMTALTPAKETVPMTALTPAKETVPMTALTPAKETVPMTALTPAKETVPMTALTPAKENTPDSDMQSFAETFFTKKNNIKLINHLSNLMALPQINFVQESNQLNKRLGDIRQLNEPNGFWIKSDTGRAKYEDMKISHQTIQMGGDKKISEHIYGVMLTHTLGNSSGEDSEEHTTLGGGGYYSWVPENGLFLDVVSKYLRTNQTWFTDSSLQRNNSTRIEMLMGSIQTGWRFTSPAGWGFIEPSVELFGGYSSGFTIKGDNIKASSQHSLPLYSKSGFSAGVNWLPDSQRQISLSTGIYKLHALYSPGEVNLSEYSDHNNKWSSLKYSNGKKDNSYLIDLSINVRLSDEWRIYAQTSTSVGGIIHDNYNGQLGLRYQF